jgi:8-oxo-dGTP pyrophosphatase MutT (NUDIX family)
VVDSSWIDESATPHLPDWLGSLVQAARVIDPLQLSAFLPPAEGGRHGAVLILFGESDDGPDVLLLERSPTMRSHPGQPAFPGGAVDPEDSGAIAAALREAAEETLLDRTGVKVFGTLPDLWIPPSGFIVTPVLGWWAQPSPVSAGDPDEVAAVHRVPIGELLNPENRVSVRHPTGYIGPGFQTRGMLVWGFTGGLLSRLFDEAGWTQDWDSERFVDIDL